ncbi:hypothetical protein O3M35_008151 [Rhynocoris fuscipes]|uniref:Uncharacterized protein n=1 Tax=Rhynocoris fuscipes TaxID=488301 RepID=A0AAW1D8V1_9HEMI
MAVAEIWVNRAGVGRIQFILDSAKGRSRSSLSEIQSNSWRYRETLELKASRHQHSQESLTELCATI